MIHKKPSISIYFDTRRKKQNGKYPIKLLITATGLRQKHKHFYFGLDLTKDEWEQVEGKGKSREILEAREEINRQLADAQRIVDSLDTYTHGQFEDRFVRGVVNEVFVYDFFERKSNSLREKGKFSTADGYAAALSQLKEYKRGRDIYFQDITVYFLQGWIDYMQDRGKSGSTAKRYFTYLKHVYNMAADEGIVSRNDSPFGSSQIQIRQERAAKKGLPDSTIKKLLEYSSDDLVKQLARDLWVFSYCIGGANMPDVARLTKDNIKEGGIYYERGKTGSRKMSNEPVIVAINARCREVIERYEGGKYLMPILEPGMSESEQYNRIKWYVKKVNKGLREIAKDLEVKRMTFGSARHSFATRMSRMGVDPSVIGLKMGHAEGSQITGTYIKKEAEQFKGLFDKLVEI